MLSPQIEPGRDRGRSARRVTELGTTPRELVGRVQRPMTSTADRADAPSSSAFADELAFALALGVRAGEVLMDRYERLEQIDYKSARDVVTEADHLSEALILDAIRARYPADAHPRRGDRRASGGRRRGADLGTWPRLDRRPARRHDQLRQRHPVLLRLDRARRRRPAGGRRHPRPDARRDVRGDRRRPGDARTASAVAGVRQGAG